MDSRVAKMIREMEEQCKIKLEAERKVAAVAQGALERRLAQATAVAEAAQQSVDQELRSAGEAQRQLREAEEESQRQQREAEGKVRVVQVPLKVT